MEEPFHVIVSTMRSGSSLCGHLLAESGWVWYAGETHTRLAGERGVAEAIEKIRAKGQGHCVDAPPCDKVLGHGHLPKNGEFIAQRADRIYLLLRHPLAVWRSQKQTGWKYCSLKALADQLALMRSLVEQVTAERLIVLSYYELTQKDSRRQIFDKSIDGYRPNSKTGQAGWGDPGKLIQSGSIRECTLEQDVEKALPKVWMDLAEPDFARAMAEFRQILKLTGREGLDTKWEDYDFFAAETLRIGNKGQRKGVLTISVSDLERLHGFPFEEKAFSHLFSDELVHRCEPSKLLRHLCDLRRLLQAEATVRFSTIDLDFIARLSLGQEPDYAQWYWEAFLKEGGEACSAVLVANHLTRSWGYRFFHNRESLRALLMKAGFDQIRELHATDAEVNADGKDMTQELYQKERFILEGVLVAPAPERNKSQAVPIVNRAGMDSRSDLLRNLRTLVFTNGEPGYLQLQDNLMSSMERVDFPMETLSVEVVGSAGGVYGTSEFNETVLKKLDLVCSVLRSGYPVLFVDVDIVFLKNPLPELLQRLEPGLDAVFQSAGQNPLAKVNTGFFLVLPTEASVSLFDASNWKPEGLDFQQIHDQQYINQKLNSAARGSFRYQTLALAQFPTGNYWFSGQADDNPTIVHYNYLKGVTTKMEKMKSFGHWF